MESGPAPNGYVAERLNHLGIVAGVCREIGLAEWLDRQDIPSHERVSVGTATVAMILNGLGFSNRRLYLVPQFFATKAVQRLVALSLVAEHRLRKQLAATGQTIPSQVNKPTDRPTMRWVFQCFEGVDLLHIRHGPGPAVALVLRLQPVHQQVLALLGPAYEDFYQSTT